MRALKKLISASLHESLVPGHDKSDLSYQLLVSVKRKEKRKHKNNMRILKDAFSLARSRKLEKIGLILNMIIYHRLFSAGLVVIHFQ